MNSLGKELFSVFHALSPQRQSEMIAAFHELFKNVTDEPSRKFYSKLIELLEKEKKENV